MGVYAPLKKEINFNHMTEKTLYLIFGTLIGVILYGLWSINRHIVQIEEILAEITDIEEYQMPLNRFPKGN